MRTTILRKARRSSMPVIGEQEDAAWVLGDHRPHPLLRPVRRTVIVVLWTLLAMPVQLLLIALPGAGKVAFARVYWSVLCRLLGLQVRIIGTPARRYGPGRPVVFVSNHSSWLDVPVLGGRLNACFVSKDDVADWPVINLVAWLGRTVYVSRQRAATGRERDDMRARLAGGDNLILFPEGTSSDGSRVLPFRSAFFAVAEGEQPPLIQPVSVVYDRVGGLPAGRAARPVFAWYGDMDLASHFWRFAQRRGLRATILLHPPLDPALWPSRKALSQTVWSMVAEGAATLRQNRPASPLHAPLPHPVADGELPAAFA
jgi:1-acyl-sn-glycerol-3-phosphate acyltransferase